MSPERWKQVDNLLRDVLGRPPGERDAFLGQAAAGDRTLEAEVRSLLAAHGEAGSFLETPAMDEAARNLALSQVETQALGDEMAGRSVGHYRIVRKLGSGGMGVVYAAEDTRLDRWPHSNSCPASDRSIPRRADRFQREARAASGLNHPNICTIHEIGEDGGRPSSPWSTGRATSRNGWRRGGWTKGHCWAGGGNGRRAGSGARRGSGPPRHQTRQHLRHQRGQPKILDFGLAQPARDARGAPITEEGMVMGTVRYMSPEQVRGLPLDRRTDLYSFGVVLHEMATGELPAAGAPVRSGLSAELDRIIGKCLEADRERRYGSAAELRTDLERLQAGPAKRFRHSWKLGGAGVLLVGLLIAGYQYQHRVPRFTDKDTIVLADFDNRTGDAIFDDTLRQGLGIELGQSPFLSLASDDRIRGVLPFMGRQKDARLTPEVAREICERIGSTAVVEGSIAPLGSQYVLRLRAANCHTGNVVDAEQVQVARKEDVLEGVSQIGRKFRTKAGESSAMLQQHSTPLFEATTRSLDALRAFTEAQKLIYTSGFDQAILSLRRAVEINPEFAQAYATLGLAYSNVGESRLAAENTRKAYELREHTSDRERLFIEFTYDRQVTGDLEKGRRTLETWARTYPRDAMGHGFLAGYCSIGTGRDEAANREAETSLAIDPDNSPQYSSLAEANLALNRVEEAVRAVERAAGRKRGVEDVFSFRYHIAFLKGDRAAMEREIAQAADNPSALEFLLQAESLIQARAGRVQEARKLRQRAVDTAKQNGRPERATLFEAGGAVWEALYGNAGPARRGAEAALQLSKSRDVEYAAALALQLAGDSATARQLAADLEKRFPADTSVQFTYLPVLRALFDPRKGLEELKRAAPYELAKPGVAFHGFFGVLFAAYLRGERYLAAHQTTEAAAEFQKIIDHYGLVLGDPLGAMARLRLAQAYSMEGNSEKAKGAWGELLKVWKDADPDLRDRQAGQGGGGEDAVKFPRQRPGAAKITLVGPALLGCRRHSCRRRGWQAEAPAHMAKQGWLSRVLRHIRAAAPREMSDFD